MQSETVTRNCSINGMKTKFNLNSLTYGPIALEPVPAELSGFVLPDSEAGFAQGEFGKIFLQEIHLTELNIQYNIFQIRKDLALDFSCASDTMQTHAALKNDSHFHIEGIGELYLAEGQFNILHGSNLKGTRFMEEGQEYRSFRVSYSPDILSDFLPVFSSLEEWFSSDLSQPKLLFKNHPLLTVKMKDIIENIIHCSYADELRRFYLDMKTKEFLFLSMMPTGQEITSSVWLTPHSMELVHESKRLLENNVEQHLNITDIARQLDINEFKLKAGFKKIFGVSMFDYLIQTKMQKAKNLVLETDKPIKEIARITGYSTKQSFLNAFKKYFHNTPGSLRKS